MGPLASHACLFITFCNENLLAGDSFVDDSFNGHYWPDELKSHMLAAFASKDGRAAFHEIETMLGELGDPYTRIIHAK
jgi:hypothetical protein